MRRLIFGAQGAFSTFIGAYLAVLCVPTYLHLDGDRSPWWQYQSLAIVGAYVLAES